MIESLQWLQDQATSKAPSTWRTVTLIVEPNRPVNISLATHARLKGGGIESAPVEETEGETIEDAIFKLRGLVDGYDATVKASVRFYCGCNLGDGGFFTDPSECSEEGIIEVEAQLWAEGRVKIECPNCRAELAQTDGHFERLES